MGDAVSRTNPFLLSWKPHPQWMDDAACRGVDPEAFFRKPEAEAKSTCAGCSVRETCRQYALENYIGHGVWGNLTEDERKAMKPKPRQARRGFARGKAPTT